MLKSNCINTTNSSKEPCLTIADPNYTGVGALPQYNKALNDSCIDSTGKFTPTDNCIARNVPTNPYYYNLMEPSLKYCGDKNAAGESNITNKFCTDYMNNNVTRSTTDAGCPVKSGFKSSRFDDDNDVKCCWYSNILLFILIIVLIAILCKHSDKFNLPSFKKWHANCSDNFKIDL
jgi:hypothetical protein